MKSKPKVIDFRRDAEEQLEAIKSRIGQEVPLSNRYVQGQRAISVAVDGEPRRFNFPMAQRLPKYHLEIWWMTALFFMLAGRIDSELV